MNLKKKKSRLHKKLLYTNSDYREKFVGEDALYSGYKKDKTFSHTKRAIIEYRPDLKDQVNSLFEKDVFWFDYYYIYVFVEFLNKNGIIHEDKKINKINELFDYFDNFEITLTEIKNRDKELDIYTKNMHKLTKKLFKIVQLADPYPKFILVTFLKEYAKNNSKYGMSAERDYVRREMLDFVKLANGEPVFWATDIDKFMEKVTVDHWWD